MKPIHTRTHFGVDPNDSFFHIQNVLNIICGCVLKKNSSDSSEPVVEIFTNFCVCIEIIIFLTISPGQSFSDYPGVVIEYR